MDGVVLEDSTLPTASTYFDDENIEYRMEAGDGCSLSDGKIKVTKEGAQLKLVFHGLTDSENYLIADNLDYDSLSPRELISKSKWEKMRTAIGATGRNQKKLQCLLKQMILQKL